MHKFRTVIDGYLTSLFLSLEGHPIKLSYDGDHTYQSTDVLDVDEALNIVFHGRGAAFSSWALSITVDDGDEPFYKRNGKIDLSNESIVKEAVTMPTADSEGE